MNDWYRIASEALTLWWLYVPTAAWQSGLAGGILLAASYFFRRRSSALRYGLLALALIKFATPPVVAFPTSVFGQFGSPQGVPVSAPPLSPTAPSASSDVSTGLSSEATPPGTESSPPAAGSAPKAIVRAATFHREAFFLAYLLGVGLIVAWSGHSRVRLWRVVAQSTGAASGLREEFEGIARSLGIRRRIRLRLISEDVAPMAFGVLRPTVLIPASLLDRIAGAELRAILAHELAHHRRKDPWFFPLETLLLAVWWFHPVLWVVVRSLRKAREDCCDDLVLQTRLVDDAAYCGSLIHTASAIGPGAWSGAPIGAGASLHPLRRRITRIMDRTVRRMPRLSIAGLLLLCVLGLILLPGKPLGVGIAGWFHRSLPTTSISGRVVSTEGIPIEGATVTADCWTAEGSARPVEARTNRDGAFRLSPIYHKVTCSIRVTAEGYYGAAIEEPDKERRESISFVLGRGATITGVARTRSGKPVSDARIYCVRLENEQARPSGEPQWLTNSWCTTDGFGNFRVDCVAPGTYRFDAYVERDYLSYHQRSVGAPVPVTSGDPMEGIAVMFNDPETESITGTVRDDKGLPMPNARLDGVNYGGQHWGARTNLLGQYRFVGVGEHSLNINCTFPMDEVYPSVQISNVRASTDPVDITAARGGRIEGSVVDADGNTPIRDAEVTIVRVEPQFHAAPGWYAEHPSARTDATGAFEINHVVPGKIVLGVSAAGYVSDQAIDVAVLPGMTTPKLTLSLHKGVTPPLAAPEDPAQCAAISGTVLNTAHEAIDAEQGIYLEYLDKPVHEVPAGYVVHDGKYVLERLMPGTYLIKAWARGGSHSDEQSQIVEAAAGKVTSVDFVLQFPTPAKPGAAAGS